MMQGDFSSMNYIPTNLKSIEEQYWQTYYRLYMESLVLQTSQAYQPMWLNSFQNQALACPNDFKSSITQPQQVNLSQNNINGIINLLLTKDSSNSTGHKEEEEKSNEPLIEQKLLQKKTKRLAKICSDCPHHNSRHYAKGMCSNCYHSRGRNKKPWNCDHSTKTHYALGLCQNCYQMNYTKSKKVPSLNNSQDM